MFCSDCGAQLPTAVPLSRCHCTACGRRFVDHPSVMLTSFIACGKRLLFIKRALPPQVGFWAIPGGFMEASETSSEGAARELWEEAGIQLPSDQLELYMAGTITFMNQVYLAYRAEVAELDCQPGEEALDAAFFSREECPWDQLAYPEVNNAIRQAYDDLDRGEFGIYHAEMSRDEYQLRPVKTR